MAIEKNSFKFVPSSTRLDSEFSSRSREEIISNEDDQFKKRGCVELDDDDDDCDSGAGSDDFDLIELGESGEEFCQIGDQSCSIPFELYDLSGLQDILSMDVWNDVLTEDERLGLTKYLPDMDQEYLMLTIKQLLTGSNFHFEVPINKLFEMLKGGLCEPRDSLYRKGLEFFHKHRHHHVIRKHQNMMVNNLVQIRESWSTSQGRAHYSTVEPVNSGTLKVSGSKICTLNEQVSPFSPVEVKHGSLGSSSSLHRQSRDYYDEKTMYDVTVQRDHNGTDKVGKKYKDFGRSKKNVNRLSGIKVLTAKPYNSRYSYDYVKKPKRSENNQKICGDDALKYRNQQGLNPSQIDIPQGHHMNLRYRTGMKKGRAVCTQNRQLVAAAEAMTMLANAGEETESDSCGPIRTKWASYPSSGEETESDSSGPIRAKWAYPGPNRKKPKPGRKNSNSNSIKDLDMPLQSLRKTYPVRKKKKQREFGCDYMTTLTPTIVNDYYSPKKGQMIEGYGQVRLLGCNSQSKKRKIKKDHVQENYGQGQSQSQHDVGYVKSARKRKWTEEIPFENVIPEAPVIDIIDEDVELESKIPKKPFTPITPTVHTGFSFSVIHLLSAVRMAMITLLPEDSVNDSNKQESDANPNVPCLTVKDIVNRVRSNPGDPCILETQEPLQDLVRGVLKIFGSKTAPLGAKGGWKALVSYKVSIKSWSWVGPVSKISLDQDNVEEVTSPDTWGLPHKLLVKLVDSFANWLKSGQETLQKIGSLPPPPLALMQKNLDEKERFQELRAQKSLNTINPSSEEVRDYFRKEEVLRYLIPDRAFAYTAVDGKKSTVAPSPKGVGKPTSKARDHFMLKKDRPPHVTILCLVRDAAARLPGRIGTRADVCTLLRDSQYIIEEVSETQLNQVVSGALDRLHYERDPCVRFDGERKLWLYLHSEREEGEDFDDDGTSTTKNLKRPKKQVVEPTDQVPVSVPVPDQVTCIEKEKKKIVVEPTDQVPVSVPDQVICIEKEKNKKKVSMMMGHHQPKNGNGERKKWSRIRLPYQIMVQL